VLTATVSYRIIAGNLDRSLANTAAKPEVAREAAYYLEKIENVKSIDDFLADDRLYRFAMKAFGLGDMAYAKAFMRKVLVEGIDNPESFARKLTDTRYREFAETFNFERFGSTTTVFSRTRQGTVDRYVRQTLEEDAGRQNEGVRLALYFERKASSITSAYNILGDVALLKVVQTVLGLPASMSFADIDRQAEMIKARLDIADLSNPDKVKALLDRFTSLWEVNNPTSPATSPAILIGQPSTIGIGESVLAALQNLKLGGQ
jgi:hypothetical protein